MPAINVAMPPQIVATWECDFNDVTEDGLVMAEPSTSSTEELQAGQVIQLTDGVHFCEGVVESVQDGYVLARPRWQTWVRDDLPSESVTFSFGRAEPGTASEAPLVYAGNTSYAVAA